MENTKRQSTKKNTLNLSQGLVSGKYISEATKSVKSIKSNKSNRLECNKNMPPKNKSSSINKS